MFKVVQYLKSIVKCLSRPHCFPGSSLRNHSPLYTWIMQDHEIIVDAYTKWLNVHPMNSFTSKTTTGKLRHLFAEHDLPDQYVTDNGTSFTNADFEEFMTNNGIKYISSSPYHPTTNYQRERAVQSVKESLKKTQDGDTEMCICRILLQYRITPLITTGVSPAELLMKRKLAVRLSRVQPDLQQCTSEVPSISLQTFFVWALLLIVHS